MGDGAGLGREGCCSAMDAEGERVDMESIRTDGWYS